MKKKKKIVLSSEGHTKQKIILLHFTETFEYQCVVYICHDNIHEDQFAVAELTITYQKANNFFFFLNDTATSIKRQTWMGKLSKTYSATTMHIKNMEN